MFWCKPEHLKVTQAQANRSVLSYYLKEVDYKQSALNGNGCANGNNAIELIHFSIF